jgi:hypothetical protein
LEGPEGGVDFEDEGRGEGVEGFGAVQLDWWGLVVISEAVAGRTLYDSDRVLTEAYAGLGRRY